MIGLGLYEDWRGFFFFILLILATGGATDRKMFVLLYASFLTLYKCYRAVFDINRKVLNRATSFVSCDFYFRELKMGEK